MTCNDSEEVYIMGRKSTKENKIMYQMILEEKGLSRATASEKLYISEDRIARIESKKSLSHLNEILAI